MNRFIMHISWIDAKIIPQTLNSIENALKYSTVPTEFIFVLNEQTFIDTPLEKTPEQQWDYFINHPFLKKCKIIKKTDEDEFWGVATLRRELMNKEGITYWGESDCMLPLEYFYIVESFDKMQKEDSRWVMSFSTRKMWAGWESIEHDAVKKYKDLSEIPEGNFWRVNGPLGNSTEERLKNIYEINEKENPNIVLLEKPRIEGSLTVLKNMPDDIICPDIDFFHDDYNLELMLQLYNIPQYHVTNIMKGHDNANPDKRSNIVNHLERNSKANERKEMNFKKMIEYVTKKARGVI